MEARSPIQTTDFKGKRVFLRADLNVPLYNGAIISAVRLDAIIPTLNCILERGGKIILATHIDRPTGYDPKLSTQLLLPWFAQHGYQIEFEADINLAYNKSFHDPKTILLLENLRFFPGEQKGDTQLAHQLSRLADYYVNDAFGMLDRLDCSVYILAQLFSPDKRTFGLLIEKELNQAEKLFHPQRPFTLIMGGNKIADKIPLIETMLNTIDHLLLGPALVFPFLKVMNKPTGAGTVTEQEVQLCNQFLAHVSQKKLTITLPLDYAVSTQTFGNPIEEVSADDLGPLDYPVTIGPKTIYAYGAIIESSKTVMYNGLMGNVAHPLTLSGTKALFEKMADSKAYTVIAGGDSTAAVDQFSLTSKIDYCSTGGGALIAYLGKKTLPALELLLNRPDKNQDNKLH